MMDKSEMELGLAKGSFSVLRLYAHPAIRAKYPVHSILALVIYGAVHNKRTANACSRSMVRGLSLYRQHHTRKHRSLD